MTEDLLNRMDSQTKEHYKELQKTNNQLQQQMETLQQELDTLTNRKLILEDQLSLSQVGFVCKGHFRNILYVISTCSRHNESVEMICHNILYLFST
jgi:lipid II:glycine glycyltransferase (peptidoglycan interpeptide bridge formation enzyme)